MKKNKPAVQWLIPRQKRPVAYSTIAVSDLIVLLAKEHKTIQDVHDAITYDIDAKNILQKYIDAGYGNAVAREMFY